jgi:predicted lipase
LLKKQKIDLALAKLCAELSEQAYYNADHMRKFLFKRVIMHTDMKLFDVDGAQAYGIKMPDYTMIIFRGTQPEEWSDIVADIKAWPKDSDTVGNVHSGFKGELDKIYLDITRWIGSINDQKFVITGHSLGAAMATLYTARESNRGADVTLYTYGSPRVGDRTWAKQFKDIPTFRFVNTNDIVCTVPPFGYYKHVGNLYYMSYTGKVHLGTNIFERTWDKIRGRFRALQKKELFSGLYDHMGLRYIKKIK